MVTTRSVSPRPAGNSLPSAARVPTLFTTMPSDTGNPPAGISTPNSAMISIFSEPCGYLVGTSSAWISPSGTVPARLIAASTAARASGLLSSMPTMARTAPVARIA